MVSPTSRTQTIRDNKVKKMGRKRKNAIDNQGSTRSQKELFGDLPPSEGKKAE
jgi:hypothetical protein